MFETNTLTAGIDISDKRCEVCILDADGHVVERPSFATTRIGAARFFGTRTAMRVALEAGTHSRWLSELAREHGHDVIVANARKVRLIYKNDRKSDSNDAEILARLARVDVKLLSPVQHRGHDAHLARGMIRSRDTLVRTRTKLINTVRSLVKDSGYRMPTSSAETFHAKAEHVPDELLPSLGPLMKSIAFMNSQIRHYDRQIAKACKTSFPETARLMQVPGVGPVTALAFVATIEDPNRFPRSRSVGPYLGLCPRRDQSGDHDPQLRISKHGDALLRRLLVGSATYIMGPFAPDTDLRRWGDDLAGSGCHRARRKATVAVARKLATLLLRLWVAGEDYEPLHNAQLSERAA